MLHWTLVLGSTGPPAAVAGNTCPPAQLTLPWRAPPQLVGQDRGSPGQPAPCPICPSGHALLASSTFHSGCSSNPTVTDVLNHLALPVDQNTPVLQHYLPPVHATQAMPYSSSTYTDHFLSAVLLQSSSDHGQPLQPFHRPSNASIACTGARSGHHSISGIQAVDTANASDIALGGVSKQPRKQQQQSLLPFSRQSSVLGPRQGSGGLNNSAALHTPVHSCHIKGHLRSREQQWCKCSVGSW